MNTNKTFSLPIEVVKEFQEKAHKAKEKESHIIAELIKKWLNSDL